MFIHTPDNLTTKQTEAYAKAWVAALFQNSGEPIPGRLVPAEPPADKKK